MDMPTVKLLEENTFVTSGKAKFLLDIKAQTIKEHTFMYPKKNS